MVQRTIALNCVRPAVLLLILTLSFSQSTDPLHTFFKQNIGLKDSEIDDIEHGKAVAKILDSPTPSEVFVFGAVFIKAPPSAYLQLAGDLDRLKSLSNYLAIQRFSDPPQPSDLHGFGIDTDDIDDLKNCKPGNCEVQLPSENIEEFQKKIDWSSLDPVTVPALPAWNSSSLCGPPAQGTNPPSRVETIIALSVSIAAIWPPSRQVSIDIAGRNSSANWSRARWITASNSSARSTKMGGSRQVPRFSVSWPAFPSAKFGRQPEYVATRSGQCVMEKA